MMGAHLTATAIQKAWEMLRTQPPQPPPRLVLPSHLAKLYEEMMLEANLVEETRNDIIDDVLS